MARTQTLIWTALPNGYRTDKATGKQYLKLSIFMSPRLETTASMGHLGEFPDFEHSRIAEQNWAATANGLTWQVETYTPATSTSAAKRATYAAAKTSAAAEPVLWDSFFGPLMPTKQYDPSYLTKVRDITALNIKSFSSSSLHYLVKRQYQAIASIPSRNYTKPTLSNLINLPNVTNPPMLNVLPTSVQQTSGVAALAGASAAAAQHVEVTKFEAFHTPYAVPVGFVPPKIPPMDFHKAVSALANYPAIMRRLGFVIDVEVPYVSAMARMSRVRVIPNWPTPRAARGGTVMAEDGVAVAHTDARYWTACQISLTSTAPIKVSKFQTASRDGKVKDGYLVVRNITNPSADPVRLHNIDVDIAMTKMLGTAVSAASLLNRATQKVVNQAARAGEVAATEARAAAVEAVASTETMGLPPLSQPVIRMDVVGLAGRIKAQMVRAGDMHARLSKIADEDPLIDVNYSEDVTRGYRVDVWDNVTRQWHRLCGRVGTYALGATPIDWPGAKPEDPRVPTKQDEGWVQLGGVSAPADVLSSDPPSEMRIHESVFDWSGWSLAVPRPGKSISEPDGDGKTEVTNTFPDPDSGVPVEGGHYLHPDLPLNVHWKVPSDPVTKAGDLPRMRFGTAYRFRARAVDLAGNGLGFSKGSTTADPGGTNDSSPYVTRAVVHKRFDPVKPPTVIPVTDPKPSESPYILVVRSYHRPDDNVVVTEDAQRHITPPRTSVSMAEACGGLDSGSTGRPLSKSMYAELCARDDWDPTPWIPPGKTQPEAQPQATVPSPSAYLPDRYARGTAFKGLPGVASTTTARTLSTSTRVSGVRIPLTSTKTTTVASFRVAFEKTGESWFRRFPFKLYVDGIEGTDARLKVRDLPALPAWNETTRVLKVELPKADEVTVAMSSYLNSSDLKVMGVHQWSMEAFKPALAVIKTLPISSLSASASAPASNVVPVAPSTTLSTTANAVISAALVGQNWMMSPPRNLTLVHAVDQPMIKPGFTSKAHMERRPGETHATLVDWMPIHGKSTVKVDINASWKESVDDPSAGAPKWNASTGDTRVPKNASVFSLTVPRSQTTVLNVGQASSSMVSAAWGVIPSTGMLVNKSVDTKPQRHFFGDTKHKVVTYKATYASRYQKYFADKVGLTFSLTSGGKTLHVPSSARPAPPVIDYIVPTFGWTHSAGSATRAGGGLRVYLERPWFSSGEDEMLAVILYQPAAYNAGFSNLEPYVTRWGNDPLFTSTGMLPASLPTYSRFTDRKKVGTNLHLREWSGNHVIAVGHKVDYDPETGRWFCDIRVDQGKAYFPFIRLALARYQPYSLPGYELSSVVKADFIQLVPNRWATASATAVRGGYSITCTMTGQTYSTAYSGKESVVKVQLQRRATGSDPDAGPWVTVPMTYLSKSYNELTLVKQSRTAYQIMTGDTRRVWKRTVGIGETVQQGYAYRALIREYEVYKSYNDETPLTTSNAERLIFAEAINLSVGV